MTESMELSKKVLKFTESQEAIEHQIEDWLKRVFESKDELVAALERLRDSYCALRAGKPVIDDAGILALVETALKNAENAKSIV